ncbi:EAL domain-containing protein [Kineococcus aurantiacus]|uniref:Diguanylate cyclase (GGDEF)-like protein n=1 Tax=Kineococcus aurantiacus TaxID=37633 RepID=A0A7Y9DPH7_9ACTN|nr:EAL domain-containing protein [Kineococcus aurantiacus]NYD24226.1 diguanylate cyclase (GGDEF)-like protein [Kineococcus aurantiacus]
MADGARPRESAPEPSGEHSHRGGEEGAGGPVPDRPVTAEPPGPPGPATPPPLVDFAAAAATTLRHLQQRIGMDSWALARRDGDDYVVLAAVAPDGVGPVAGGVMAWCDTFCAAVLAGRAPVFSTRVHDTPAWDHARRATGFPWTSYLSVPLTGPDGTVLGSLCAGAHPSDPARTRALEHAASEAMAEVELAASLLGTLLAYEVRLQQEARRAERAEAAAERDALTGVGNRRAWDGALAAEEARARALGGTASVLVLDLDALKETNDTHGHEAGDALLVQTARVIGEHLREADLLARLGGDEFAVLLPDVDEPTAAQWRTRLQAALQAAHVSVSVGAATRRAATGLGAAWRQADAAMYLVKTARAGRRVPPVPAGTTSPPGTAAERAPGASGPGGPGGLVAAATGAPVPGTDGTVQGLASLDDAVLTARIEQLLEAARRQLGLETTVLARFDGQSWRLHHTATAPGVPDHRGFACPRRETYCQRLLEGHLDAVVPDTRADPVTAGLPLTRALDVGAYLAAPVHLADGTLYGTVCALSRTAEPDLRPRDVGVLELLADALSVPLTAHLQRARRRRDTLAALDALARAGGPRPVYQPVVELRTGRVLGHEALSRFPHDGPEAWFARAAAAGVGPDLELDALRAALRRRPAHPGEALFLNVGPALAGSPALARTLEEHLLPRADHGTGRDLSGIVVEITEHEQVQDYPALLRHLEPLRRDGLRLAVDDAGAGFASMRHVLALHPEFVKLDISLVHGIATDTTRQALAASLVAFAERTCTHLIAEGVESEEELRFLRDLGVAYGQGVHLGPPVDAAPPAHP